MGKKLKTENKQFFKYWLKESNDWRRIKLHARKKYRILCKLSERVEIPIYSLVGSLLEEEKERITISNDKRIFEERAEITISLNEFRAILDISGYEYKTRREYYYFIRERLKRMLNVCDATRICSKVGVAMTLRDRIKERRYNFYNKLKEMFERKTEKLSIDISPTALKVEPANGERISMLNGAFNKIIVLLCVVLLIFFIFMAIRINFEYKQGIESSPFWNVLIGACIPGVATVLTTFLLIRNQYKVDYHRERMGALPVFSMARIVNKEEFIDQDGKWDFTRHSPNEFFNTSYTDSLLDHSVILYEIINKGLGVAFNVLHDKGDEEFEFGDIAQGCNYYIAIKEYEKLDYVISYMDVYGNMYTQRFHIVKDREISSYPPELVLRTKLIRYQQ